MASPNSSFTDIVTTTLQGYSGELADNITNHNALLRQIDKKGNKKKKQDPELFLVAGSNLS